jgi:hypothetical protein
VIRGSLVAALSACASRPCRTGWSQSGSPTGSTPRALRSLRWLAIVTRRARRCDFGFGRIHWARRSGRESSGSRHDLDPSIRAVTPLRRSPLGIGRVLRRGLRASGFDRFTAGSPAADRSDVVARGIGHRWLAGGGRPRDRQPSVTSRACGSERARRRGCGHGDRQTDGCGETLEWRQRTGKARVCGLRTVRSTPSTGRPRGRAPRDRSQTARRESRTHEALR